MTLIETIEIPVVIARCWAGDDDPRDCSLCEFANLCDKTARRIAKLETEKKE